MKNQRNERGITLVALVVTIVVLLILAGITIMYVMQGNSVFDTARDAQTGTRAGEVRDAVATSLLAIQTDMLTDSAYTGSAVTDDERTRLASNQLITDMEAMGMELAVKDASTKLATVTNGVVNVDMKAKNGAYYFTVTANTNSNNTGITVTEIKPAPTSWAPAATTAPTT